MINSKYLLFTLLIMASLFSSCKKYLEVYPKTEIAQKELLTSESGFKDAITGIYIQMKDENVYGKFLTMGRIEDLVSSWDASAGSIEANLNNFNYTNQDVTIVLGATFSKQYNIIANINAILGSIDEKKDVFGTPGLYETIKGECLALRAYCHLDLLRLWGPIPTAPANGNKLAYVTTLSTKINDHIAFEQYKQLLLKDLTAADSLLHKVDPIVNYSLDELSNTIDPVYKPQEAYFADRYLKMNYYAVKALEARAYLWFGDKQNAYSSAMAVINAQNRLGSPTFRIGTSTDMSTNKDYNLGCEQIFGLYDYNLATRYSAIFASGGLKRSTTNSAINTYLFAGVSATDARAINLWEVIPSKGYTIKKYKADGVAPRTNQIPMLRVSEMYLIAIEANSNAAEAQALWNTFSAARNLTVTTLPSSPADLQNMLLVQYRRELYAEGQSFFAYKRLNTPNSNIIFVSIFTTLPPINYLLPLPPVETLDF